jgi:membrane protease YdiL (CAAX protease family)
LFLVEAVDTVLILAALLWTGLPPRLPPVSRHRRVGAWLLCLPVLAFLLAANYGYHWFLRHSLSIPLVEDPFAAEPGFALWALLGTCVQPALVEEFFFRYLALGFMRPVMRGGTAVVLSAVMFGMAHIFAPLSIPILILIGLALGALRLAGASLWPAILLHFAHNAFITFAPPFLS